MGAWLRRTVQSTYHGQLLNIKSTSYLVTAAQIATVEARHSGAIGIYLGKAIAPKPLDTPLAASAVLKAVAGTGFIKG